MPAQDQEAKNKPQVIDLQSLPENSKVHIHVGNSERDFDANAVRPEYSKRSLMTMISGAIGAAIGGFTTSFIIKDKMFDFNTEVLDKTKNNILGRSGIGAGMVESGVGMGGLAGALGSGEIHMSNATRLAQTGKYGSLPKLIYKIPGGESTLALAGAAAAGTIAAAIAYNSIKPDKKPDVAGKDWAEKVAVDKDQPRVIS